jgi:hypothetical protein
LSGNDRTEERKADDHGKREKNLHDLVSWWSAQLEHQTAVDILSHGLWGGVAFGRRSRRSFWLAFVLGLAPDLLSFGILWAAVILGVAKKPDFSHGTPPEATIPEYVHALYNVTHSFLVFLLVFFVVWVLHRRPMWELAAWGLHLLVDVPTHSYAFFPTPIFWPFFNWKFDGWQWMNPAILIPNYALLAFVYTWLLVHGLNRRKRHRPDKPK